MVRASRLLGEHDEVAVMPRRGAAPVERPARQRGWQTAALAAGLTGLIAIGGWVASVQQVHQLERMAAGGGTTAPVLRGGQQAGEAAAGTLLVNLQGATRGEPEGEARIPASAGHATLVLHPSAADTYKQHAFQIRNGKGDAVGPEAPLAPNPEDFFYSVDLDLKLLPPGGYAIQTFGTDGGAHIPVDRFPFTVTPQ
jgi:hypothetical protein